MVIMMKNADNARLFDLLDFGLGDNAVSHNDTTGLIPSAPLNEDELHSYLDIDDYRQQPIIPPAADKEG